MECFQWQVLSPEAKRHGQSLEVTRPGGEMDPPPLCAYRPGVRRTIDI